MRSRAGVTACALVLFAVGTADALSAQATGMPTFFAPTRAFGSSEVGGTLSRPGGSTTALELRFGTVLDRADLAFRVGYADPGGSADGAVIAGVEARVPVLGHSDSFPLDGAFILGVGHRFQSGGGQTMVPLGLSLGRRLVLDGSALQLTPYVQPTVIFVDNSVVTLGFGLDIRARGIPEIRVNGAAGDMDGFSISLFWAR